METYLLKSAACLAILLLFYKLLLEKENMHKFKRFYLLGAVFIAFLFPFITFEAASASPTMVYENSYLTGLGDLGLPAEKEIDYLPYILWTIYGLGVLIFGFRFLKNIGYLIRKIKQNSKLKKNRAVYVLLREETAPHTFWDYIFLNKQKFEKHAIPQEVFQHEEAHAQQKHSFDILLMELLQIIFWFNPLIYFTENAIKLNHEFLADQAVLKNGIIRSAYQEILLSYSSNQPHIKLANPINYSSLKKRFTIMKTKTSKTTIWARTLLLIPVLAALVYSCSQKEIVEREYPNPSVMQDSPVKKATPVMVAEYNKLAKYYNSLPEDHSVIRMKDLDRMKRIYSLMTPEQKKKSEKLPNILPPPPPPPVPSLTQDVLSVPQPPVPPAPTDFNLEMPSAPPAPPAPLEHIKKLAAQGARFFLIGKGEISSKEAIEMVKNKKNISIKVTEYDSETTVVISEEN
ncbi:MAG TPA: M56 family metallopeptidase [Salinimicrobium sp.]|nr:M56 family metallopeptidase [Salinimicrobium sp.]